MENYKSEFIDLMITSGVLTFGEFTLKSGRKSPYFINTGNYKTGMQIAKLGKYYAQCIMNTIGDDFDVLFGPAYKGIPLATATAYALYTDYGLDKKYCFNRKEEKDHGEGGIFVGAKLTDGDRVIYIEDVTTSGASIRETMPLLKAAADVTVKYEFISANRMEKMATGKTAIAEIEEEFGMKIHSIVNVVEIIEHIKGKYPAELVASMEDYLSQYCLI
jgi:orotate phosphoribosyltransferase